MESSKRGYRVDTMLVKNTSRLRTTIVSSVIVFGHATAHAMHTCKSGTKADPLSVSREMKFKRDDKGELVFQPEEWKTAKTIKSFFSRYSAKLKQQGVSKPKDMGDSQPEVEEEMADDMEALEYETAMQNLRQAVYNDLKIPEHPIEVNQFNICKLMQEGKLKTLKLQDLKAICTTIGLPTEGSQARKKSFVEPLKELVKKCTCKGSSDVY